MILYTQTIGGFINKKSGKDEETSLLRDLERRRLVSRGDGNLPDSKKGEYGDGIDGNFSSRHKKRKNQNDELER